MSRATALNDSRNAPSSFSDDVDESSSPRFFDNPDVQTPAVKWLPRTKPFRRAGAISPNEANARDQTNPMAISGRWVEKSGVTLTLWQGNRVTRSHALGSLVPTLSGHSFPRSAWECRPGRSASLCRDQPTRSVEDGIPTRSVGTRPSAMFRSRVRHPARFACDSVDFSRESASQTNPLARSDVLSSEIVVRPPGRRLPKRSQRPFYQTNPMAISGRWVEKSGDVSRESASQTNPLARSDVLSSEIIAEPLGASHNSLSPPYEGGAGGGALGGSVPKKATPPNPPFVRGGVLLDAPGRRFPERSQRPFYQTNPLAISGRWVEKSGDVSRESASQTNPLARSDVLSSEIIVTPPCLAQPGGAA